MTKYDISKNKKNNNNNDDDGGGGGTAGDSYLAVKNL